MSAETITTALFLITAVVTAGVLINAVYPVVFTMAGTFSSSTHESDVRMRTDFKIIATYAKAGNPGIADVYLKNIGSQRISATEIPQWDVFFGKVGEFIRIPHGTSTPGWIETFDGDASYDINGNHYWDPGETIKITAKIASPFATDDPVYFQISLPNGIWRSNEFTVS
jgi:archaeal flagellar protein FlaG